MVARIQGFPDYWEIQGRKTSQYRQIGNAFPAPVAMAVGKRIYDAIKMEKPKRENHKEPTLFTEYAMAWRINYGANTKCISYSFPIQNLSICNFYNYGYFSFFLFLKSFLFNI